ncbi:putative diphthamide synthesis protein-domain-containing protein [Syncephalis fuscata]|nr:putative diphthamide synthesis protein-domain-containing protein [Syncephalis fuscata]
MELQGPAGFADDGRAVLERQVDLEATAASRLVDEAMTEDQLLVSYEIERTVSRILTDNYQRIALQMPDGMLRDSAWVARQLTDKTERSVFILADTSYGSCCVDEIAAQHVNADFIVHYGPSCLSATQRLPVMYVFGRAPIDVKACATAFDNTYNGQTDSNIVIVSDVIYQYAIEDIMKEIHQLPIKYTNLTIATALTESQRKKAAPSCIAQTSDNNSCCSSKPDTCCSNQADTTNDCCRSTTSSTTHEAVNVDGKDNGINELDTPYLTGRQLNLPNGVSFDDCLIFYIGEEGRTLTNLLMTHNKAQFCTSTDKTRLESATVNRALMKRYYLVQKAKDADVIGIVAGTLGVTSYMQVIEHLKQTIKQAGKKFYLFSVGKLNVAKLANFPEIDLFVLVACPENSLIDGKEFYRPVVTPFELDLALVSGREWTGEFAVNFQEILERGNSESNNDISTDEEDNDNKNNEDEDEEDLPRFSLVSDDDLTTTTSLVDDQLSSLTLRNQNNQVTTWRDSPAVKYLAQREFQGLEQRLGEDTPAVLEIGRSGIARGYGDEVGREDQDIA